MNSLVLRNEFVDSIPDTLDDMTLYVSMEFATVMHNCCCGCGNQVVTPLSPTDWKLTYDGQSVSLHPSVGNWGFSCQSHYWIQGGKVRWASKWDASEIDEGRRKDKMAKQKYYESINPPVIEEPILENVVTTAPKNRWQRWKRWLHRWISA